MVLFRNVFRFSSIFGAYYSPVILVQCKDNYNLSTRKFETFPIEKQFQGGEISALRISINKIPTKREFKTNVLSLLSQSDCQRKYLLKGSLAQ